MRGDPLKFFAFDWDDNLMKLPTKIKLEKEGKIVEKSTEEFAKIREEIKSGIYNILPNEESFSGFREVGDEDFMKDVINIKQEDLCLSWPKYVESINEARLLAIITARGHSVKTFKKIIRFMINNGFYGINKDKFLKNMSEFIKLAYEKGTIDSLDISDTEMLDNYLELIQIYPVSNKKEMSKIGIDSSMVSPEKAKTHAGAHFAGIIMNSVNQIYHPFEIPLLKYGFSDDDPKNIEIMENFIKEGGIGNIFLPYIYDTSNGKIKKIKL